MRDMEKRIRDDLDAAEGRRMWDGEEEREEDPLFMLLQQFGSFFQERGVSFAVVCEGYELGEWAYEEGGMGAGFVFFAFVVDAL